MKLKSLAFATIALTALAGTAFADDSTHRITNQHLGTQCDGWQFDDVDVWYGIGLTAAAWPGRESTFEAVKVALGEQADGLIQAANNKQRVSFFVPGDYMQCKLDFGNNGMILRITDVDQVF
jgi:hypothetical protein